MVDLMQGRIELSVSTIPPTLQQIREGKLRALATMSEQAQRDAAGHPDASPRRAFPAAKPALWTAIVVPAGTPAAIVKRLNEAVLAVAAAADVQQAMKIQGVDPEPGTPECGRRADQGRHREMEGGRRRGQDRGRAIAV